MKIVLYVLSALLILFALLVILGLFRMHGESKRNLQALHDARVPQRSGVYYNKHLESLPEPVKRYFRQVLPDGQPPIESVSLEQSGLFNMGEEDDNWKSFSAVQHVVTDKPGFDWEARVAVAPGLSARVHDTYIGEEGSLHVSLLGLISVVDMGGSADISEGEFLRYFAEAAWYPTALLPGRNVRWQGVDDRSAVAYMTDGHLTAQLLFRFGEDGLIQSVYAESRGRTVGNEVVPTPWEGRWSRYERHEGILVPMAGEVSWILPEGEKLYWQGEIRKIEFEFSFRRKIRF